MQKKEIISLIEESKTEIPLLVKTEVSQTLKAIDFLELQRQIENLHIVFRDNKESKKAIQADYRNMKKMVGDMQDMVEKMHETICVSSDSQHPSIMERQNTYDREFKEHLDYHKSIKSEKTTIIGTSVTIIGILLASLTAFLVMQFSNPNIKIKDLKPAIREVVQEIVINQKKENWND